MLLQRHMHVYIKAQLYKSLFQRYMYMYTLYVRLAFTSPSIAFDDRESMRSFFILASYNRPYQADSRLDCQVCIFNKQTNKKNK